MLHRTRVLRRSAVGALHRSVHGEGGRAAAFEARSVLLLPKTPRWRHELASRGLSEVVARELLARGEAWPRAAQMCQANDAHAASVAHLERCFGEAGIAVRTLAAAEATAAQVAAHAPALVCTAGGDGTLLRTATLLPPSTPLLAINTDPAPSYVQKWAQPCSPGYGSAPGVRCGQLALSRLLSAPGRPRAAQISGQRRKISRSARDHAGRSCRPCSRHRSARRGRCARHRSARTRPPRPPRTSPPRSAAATSPCAVGLGFGFGLGLCF